ncbi:hypothetical protein I306_03611 [Cryptococcus gattii EJB2]|uniref:Secreted protein n=1 Tax=Cryptococcus gattii EJB2 TaxID=1296103 RepID=A0ABR5BUL7_9TREE|nr:hypothetical protein I306_03611 [Cryptococcus gattii EJB2]
MQRPRHAFAAALFSWNKALSRRLRRPTQKIPVCPTLCLAQSHTRTTYRFFMVTVNVWAKLGRNHHEAKILGSQLILALAVVDVSIESSRFLQPAANQSSCCKLN